MRHGIGRGSTFARASVAAFAVLLLATAAAGAISAAHAPLIRNLCVLAGVGVVLAQPARRAVDLPWSRGRFAGPFLSGATAVAVAWPTLSLPYFADDWYLLETRGRQASILASMSIPAGEPWFRPAGWILWWVYDKASGSDARLAHAVNLGLFSVAAMLVQPALRRCGAPRGLATAGALLFAVHPAGLETTAWVTNLYSLLAACGFLAALAWLPVGRAPWWRRAIPCACALLAYLSKEDSYASPLLVLVVGARYRPRFFLAGLRAAWPFAIAAAAVALSRHLLLESGAPYRDPATGESAWLRRILYGPHLALETEFPSGYVLPLRGHPTRGTLSYLWSLLPAALLAAGGMAPGLGRQFRTAAPFVVLGLLPVAPLLPIGRNLETIRWLYVPSIGMGLLAASTLAGLPFRGRARWFPILLYAALSAAAGRSNFSAWRESAALLTGGLEATAPSVQSMRPDGRAWILGIPWIVRGAYCANCGVPQLFQRAHDRRDAEFLDAASAVGALDLAIVYEPKEGGAESFVRARDAVSLVRGTPWGVQFGEDGNAESVRAYGLGMLHLPKALRVKAGLPGTLALPPMRAPAGSSLRVDGVWAPRADPGGGEPPWLHITQSTRAGLLRMRRPFGRPFPMNEGVELFRLDVALPYGAALEIASLKVELVP